MIYTEEEIVIEQEYRIRVSGVEDLYGQEMEAAEVGIRYLDFGTVEPGDLAINEVLYRRKGAGDPQFVEIYNRTEVNVDLSGWFQDRKSTRLNSSHVAISYAVFCLKKKK